MHEGLHHLLLGDVKVADALANVVPLVVRDACDGNLEEVIVMCYPSVLNFHVTFTCSIIKNLANLKYRVTRQVDY